MTMQFRERQEDLSKVFDRTWIANHNDDIKNAKEKERKFMNRMFNIPNNDTNKRSNVVTPQMKLDNLQSNIKGASDIQRTAKVNGILNKWK